MFQTNSSDTVLLIWFLFWFRDDPTTVIKIHFFPDLLPPTASSVRAPRTSMREGCSTNRRGAYWSNRGECERPKAEPVIIAAGPSNGPKVMIAGLAHCTERCSSRSLIFSSTCPTTCSVCSSTSSTWRFAASAWYDSTNESRLIDAPLPPPALWIALVIYPAREKAVIAKSRITFCFPPIQCSRKNDKWNDKNYWPSIELIKCQRLFQSLHYISQDSLDIAESVSQILYFAQVL